MSTHGVGHPGLASSPWASQMVKPQKPALNGNSKQNHDNSHRHRPALSQKPGVFPKPPPPCRNYVNQLQAEGDLMATNPPAVGKSSMNQVPSVKIEDQEDIGFTKPKNSSDHVLNIRTKFEGPSSSPSNSPWTSPGGSPSRSPRSQHIKSANDKINNKNDSEKLVSENSEVPVAGLDVKPQPTELADETQDKDSFDTFKDDSDNSISSPRMPKQSKPLRGQAPRIGSDGSSQSDSEQPPRLLPRKMSNDSITTPTHLLEQNDIDCLQRKVPAPAPRRKQTSGSSDGGSGSALSQPQSNRQDPNNNKNPVLTTFTASSSSPQKPTSASSLDDGYLQLADSTTGQVTRPVPAVRRNPKGSLSPKGGPKRKGTLYQPGEVLLQKPEEVLLPISNKTHPDSDTDSDDYEIVDGPRMPRAVPLSPGVSSSLSNSQVGKVHMEVNGETPEDSNPSKVPPLPEKTKPKSSKQSIIPDVPAASSESIPFVPTRRKKKEADPVLPGELIQSVPAPFVPPRSRPAEKLTSSPTLSPSPSFGHGDQFDSTTGKKKLSRVNTLDIPDVEDRSQCSDKIRMKVSLTSQSLLTVHEPPPLPPRSPTTRKKLDFPVEIPMDIPSEPAPTLPHMVTHRKNKVLDPDTIVPPPLSPLSTPDPSPTTNLIPTKNKPSKLRVQVPAPESPRKQSKGAVDDDIPTSPAPFPPGYMPMDGTSSRNRDPRFQGSYIDPNAVESVPDFTPSGKMTQDPFQDLWGSTRSAKNKKRGAHNSYLDLFNDEESDPGNAEAVSPAANTLEPENDYYSFLADEPLYQVYHRDMVAREIVHQTGDPAYDEEDEDYMYMDAATVQNYVSNMLSMDSSESEYDFPPRKHSSLQDVIKLGTGTRKLWCEMPEVKKTGVLNTMSTEDKRLQETLFEVITSEASYVKSLNLLISHFFNSAYLTPENQLYSVISKQHHHILFSNVKKVRQVSTGFLQQLESMWHDSCILEPSQLATTISDYAQKHFDVYVVYVKNQMYQERVYKELKEKEPEFVRVIQELELNQASQGLTLQSFLVLPMQRITRLPLLVDSICHRMEQHQPGYSDLQQCLNVLQKIVKQCNEGARQLANIEQVAKIDKMLEFKNCRRVAVVSQHRSLVKQGQLTRILPQSSFFRKKELLYLFLFNDLLIITKKSKNDVYTVIEHTSRIAIHAQLITDEDVVKWLPSGVPSGCKHLIVMALMEKDVKFIFSCDSMNERQRWVEAVTPVQHTDDNEKIYEEWDCPQVQAVQRYVAEQPDELSLEESDIVHVSRKMADGWFEGERIRDGEKGWFPSSVTVEIQSAHLRAKNLRQHYRLLCGMAKSENR